MTLHALASPQPAFAGSRLVLSTKARVFTREVRVYVEPDEPGANRPLSASASWSHATRPAPPPPSPSRCPPSAPDGCWWRWTNGDNAPLALEAGRLLLPSYRLASSTRAPP